MRESVRWWFDPFVLWVAHITAGDGGNLEGLAHRYYSPVLMALTVITLVSLDVHVLVSSDTIDMKPACSTFWAVVLKRNPGRSRRKRRRTRPVEVIGGLSTRRPSSPRLCPPRCCR